MTVTVKPTAFSKYRIQFIGEGGTVLAESHESAATYRFTGKERYVRAKVLVSSDLGRHVQWLRELAELGFDEIALHHVGQDLDPFIDAFGEHVLPALR